MSLGRIQFVSLVTKSITTALGIAQSIIVVRVLSPAEFGLVGLVMSIGGLIGVTQHLGIVDGAIREIAILNKDRDVGKVFWVSHIVRQAVTIPLSVGLVLLASSIAVHMYGRPEIVFYIQLFAIVLVLQGLQDVLGATLTGMKKFTALYFVQIITAAVNIAVFGYLTLVYGISGFFWAVIITTSIMVALLTMTVASYLRGNLALPTWDDIKQYTGRVMRIGAYMYVARIFFVIWQRLPLLVLGGVLAADELGFINVSLTFGSKITVVAMALSEVNLAWMSSLYVREKEKFAGIVQKNLQRVLILMMAIASVLLFFVPEILTYVIGPEYAPAHDIILIITVAFFLYSLIDIGTSSVFVPADQPRSRALVYGVMTIISGGITGWLLLVRPEATLAAYAVLLGAASAYGVMIILAKRRLNILLINTQQIFFLCALGVSVAWLLQQPSLYQRIAVFLLLIAYVSWEARRSQLLPKLSSVLPDRAKVSATGKAIICFAGAFYHQPSWTNRQYITTGLAEQYPVLYVEPRVWIVRFILTNWRQPIHILRFLQRVFWYERMHDNLYIKAQWNLIPGSREYQSISRFNHALNKWNIMLVAKLLGFPVTDAASQSKLIIWLYDTEAAEYLPSFSSNTVIYDCVDDHAAQAGVNRNPQRVREEERRILRRANLVTVTSQRLLEQKQRDNPNTHLVPNAGDVDLFTDPPVIPWPFTWPEHSPVIGSVGALDSYKYDFDLLHAVALQQPDWTFVLIGQALVKQNQVGTVSLTRLSTLPNVHVLPSLPREKVPSYVQHFDICMIPYRNNEYNQASFPLKFWECMASGKPTIVSGVPELLTYQNLISYITSPAQFIAAVQSAAQDTPALRTARMSAARDHRWSTRVTALRQLLDRVIVANT